MVNLAKVSVAAKKPADALDMFNRAFVADPQNFDALSGIVNVCIGMKQSRQAIAKVDWTIANNAGRGDVLAALHFLKSTIYTADAEIVSAENELRRSIELDGNYLPAYSAYASIFVSRNETAGAIAQYQIAAAKSPSAPVYSLLGMLEDSRGNTAEAEKNYRRALEIAPDSSIAANNLAWLLAENDGNLDEALQLANASLAKNQTVAGFYDTLGWVYFKKGLYSPAVEQLRKAVALDEKSGKATNPAYRVRLGTALARAGDKASVRREGETSLRSSNELSRKDMGDAGSVLASF